MNFKILFSWLICAAFALQAKTVKVSNVSLGATEQDVKEFFSFSGEIEHVEMQRFTHLFLSPLVAFSLEYMVVPGGSLDTRLLMYISSFIPFNRLIFLFFLFSETERSQLAYVTFKDCKGAETAVLLSVDSLLNAPSNLFRCF